MKLLLPPMPGVDESFDSGPVRQWIEAPSELHGTAVKFVVPSASGLRFTGESGEVVYVFPKRPSYAHVPTDGSSVIGTVPDGAQEVDLRKSTWFGSLAPKSQINASQVLESWLGAFRYVGEGEVAHGAIALRKPQIGALHAIHAHWSVSAEVATIVMPIGTGKTETM